MEKPDHGEHAPRIDLTARDLNTFPDGCLVCRAELRGVRRPARVTGLEFVFECGTVYRREDDAVEVAHRGDCCNALELALQRTRIICRETEPGPIDGGTDLAHCR